MTDQTLAARVAALECEMERVRAALRNEGMLDEAPLAPAAEPMRSLSEDTLAIIEQAEQRLRDLKR